MHYNIYDMIFYVNTASKLKYEYYQNKINILGLYHYSVKLDPFNFQLNPDSHQNGSAILLDVVIAT